MIKSIYFPKREFSTKEEMFTEFRGNIKGIIDLKKADIQKSCDKGIAVTCKSLDLLKLSDQVKALKIDDAYYYIAVNTTRILDSHNDLHIDGIWNKSIKEQQGNNYLVADHELCIDDVIVRKEYIEMMVVKMPFALLGQPYQGDTQALIYKFPKDKVVHAKAKEWLESGDQIEASVRMQYVTIELAMDSNHPSDETEKQRYDEYLPMIANKADFEYIPYFFVVKEAKNVRESSLVVLGSNSVTGNINNTEPEKSTQIDPPSSSQKVKSFYSHFLN